MKKCLTSSVLQHRKQGFGVPLTYWFKEDLKEYVNNILMNQKLIAYQYLDYDYVNRQVVNHNTGFRDLSADIWSVLSFNECINQNK